MPRRGRSSSTAAQIDGKTILRVYTGRQGCMCGCRGSYSTNPATIKRMVAKMLRFPRSSEPDKLEQEKLCELVGTCFSVDYDRTDESPGRTIVAYYDSAE